MGDDSKVVKGEYDIQRNKTRVTRNNSDTSRGLWFGDVVIKCTGEEKIKVFEMMCLRNICAIRRMERVRNATIRGAGAC